MMNTEHSSKQYDLDLEAIRSKVLLMGGLVEQQVNDALAAFINADGGLAQQVMSTDAEVNRLELTLDNLCTHLIVKRQPAANDLRAVMTTVKTITDLERIGDEAAKIARLNHCNVRARESAISYLEAIRELGSAAQTLLRDALDAYSRLDGRAARFIINRDAAIDEAFRQIVGRLMNGMDTDSKSLFDYLDAIWAAKALERVGDHAKNIAEYVVYVAEGQDIRHQNLEPLADNIGTLSPSFLPNTPA